MLHSLNIKKDDVIVLSSDLSKLAYSFKAKGIPLNVNSIIDGLQEILSEGTLFIPAFTDHLVDGDEFNWKHAKPTTGAVSNKVQRRKDFVRTNDPLHSYFVWGKNSHKILEIKDDSTFGEHSVFAYFKRKNAKFVLLDVHLQNALTYIHYVEEQHRVHYRKPYYYNIRCIYSHGIEERTIQFYSRKLGVRTYLEDLYQELLKRNVTESYLFDKSRIDIFMAQDIWEIGGSCISKGPKLYQFHFMNFAKDFIKRHILRRKGVF